MKFKLLIPLIFSIIIIASCKDLTNRDKGEFVIDYGTVNDGTYPCGYIFDKNNILTQNVCYPDSPAITRIIYFYNNGLIKSFEPFIGKKLHGTKIDYYESGIIKQITEYKNGIADGVIKIYYPSGYIRAINLIENDSIYYVRVYPDSLKNINATEEIQPIVKIENDSFKVSDSIEIQIRLPFNNDWGLDSTKYILRYDQKPAHLLEGKLPFANYSVNISEEDIWVGITSPIPGYDKFYCYITDKNGKVMGPTIYRNLYFVK